MISDSQARANIAANVKRILDEKGISQSDLSRATGDSAARISHMIHGKRLPSAGFLYRIAQALGVRCDDLVESR